MAVKGSQYEPAGNEFWFVPTDTGSLGWSLVGVYSILEIPLDGGCAFTFRLPDDFTDLTWARLVMIPDTDETVQAGFFINASAAGEDPNHNWTINLQQPLVVSANRLTEWDITAFFPSLSAGDHVGMYVLSSTDILRVVGLAIRCT